MKGLLGRLFGGRGEAEPADWPGLDRPARLPGDTVVYAIGDIHGRLDCLEALLAEVGRTVARRPGSRHVVLPLGDMIDRGNDSNGVIERLSAGVAGAEVVALKGNHEAFLFDFLDRRAATSDWLEFGGIETCASYGVAALPGSAGRAAGSETRERLARAIPPHHILFLSRLKSSFSLGDYFFCHAGIRPGVPFEDQRDRDLLWIRDEFLRETRMFEKRVVHGHTPVDRPEVLPNRINLDTGAYLTGHLAMAIIADDAVEVVST